MRRVMAWLEETIGESPNGSIAESTIVFRIGDHFFNRRATRRATINAPIVE